MLLNIKNAIRDTNTQIKGVYEATLHIDPIIKTSGPATTSTAGLVLGTLSHFVSAARVTGTITGEDFTEIASLMNVQMAPLKLQTLTDSGTTETHAIKYAKVIGISGLEFAGPESGNTVNRFTFEFEGYVDGTITGLRGTATTDWVQVT